MGKTWNDYISILIVIKYIIFYLLYARDGQFLLFKFVFDRLANDKNKLEETDCFGIRNEYDIHILLIKNEQFRYF